MTQKYRFVCTLTFGDIYPQVIAWLGIVLVSVAASLATMGSDNPRLAFLLIGLILVISLPFLLFAFVTTLFNHIEIRVANPQGQDEREPFMAPPSIAPPGRGR
ncbi:hypothetical protein [Anthocerotibacter panamensis]|uniref:hypothetical protein n=1 Tax=Anthocerotibacter panamensis TaxID=2857077 RepID=UPI001C4082DE|nr:hypothetical protein [Anthocerotibacter panamensis]